MECFEADGLAIAAAAEARPDEPVPTCPGWTMTGLTEHVAGVFAFARASLLAADGVRPSRPTPGPLREELALTLEVLASIPSDAERPTLVGLRPPAWWARRLHHEMAVHRVDAYPGIEPTWITEACALDGIAEYVDVLLPTGAVPEREAADGMDAVGRFLRLWGR